MEILTLDGNPELVDSDAILLTDDDEADGVVEEKDDSVALREESYDDTGGREAGNGRNILGGEEAEFNEFGDLGMKIDEIFDAVDWIK